MNPPPAGQTIRACLRRSNETRRATAETKMSDWGWKWSWTAIGLPISWGGLGGQLIGIYGSPMECLGLVVEQDAVCSTCMFVSRWYKQGPLHMAILEFKDSLNT